MKTIALTKGYVAQVDDADFEWLNQFKWTTCVSPNTVYAYRKINNKTVGMHQFILNPPPGFEPDHIDGDGLNNQRFNLRLATHKQNCANSKIRKDNTSGVKGVTWRDRDKRWRVTLQYRHVGNFNTLAAAKVARRMAEIAAYGEFAPNRL